MKCKNLFLITALAVLATGCIKKNNEKYWNWYKGNTHTHATFSDVNDTNDVPEIASWYADAGYNFLVLSEHNDHLSEKRIYSHDELSKPPSFLMISGLELSNSRHHLAFGINKYIGDETSLKDGVEKTLAADGIPILNHPQSPVITASAFIAIKGLNHLEVLNGGRPHDTRASEMLWDSILSDPGGRKVFAVAADDNHYKKENVGRGWIMVKARELTREAILESFRKGNYYATNGIIITYYEADNNGVGLETQNGDTIRFIGRNGDILKTVPGKKGSYEFTGGELYVRARITGNGKTAWTQPLFLNSGEK